MARTSLISLALTLLFGGTALAQSVGIQLFQPPPNQLRISDLWRVQVQNLTREPVEIFLRGIVTEERDGEVVNAESRVFTLQPGGKVLTGRELEPIEVISSNSKYRGIVTRTGTVPSGDYEICVYAVDAATGEILGEDCLEHTVERLSPPLLIAPTDESTLADPLPIFTWTPPVPAPSGGARLLYRLRIAEVLGRQSPFDALRSNPPFFEQQNIRTPTFQFPGRARPFIDGRRYAWRITAYENGVAIGESEVWSFRRNRLNLQIELAEADAEQKITAVGLLGLKGDRVIAGSGSSGMLADAPAKSSGGKGFAAAGSLTSGGGKKTLDAQAWTWGNNEYYVLGTGPLPAVARAKPTTVTELDHIRDLALGAEHALAIDIAGNVASWGNNDYGQLGTGSFTKKNRPAWIPGLSGALEVAAGNYHSVALRNNGTVWSWGYNRSGELGRGSEDDDTPGQVNLSSVVAISAGNGHTLALKSDGTVWAWGTNRYGQVDPSIDAVPIVTRPRQVEGLSKVTAISAGGTFSMALLEDGTIRTWGSDRSGQLGSGTAEPGATLINKMILGTIRMPEGSDGKEGPKRFRSTSSGSSGGTTAGGGAMSVVKEMELGMVLINVSGIVKVSGLTNITAIDAGGAHALALRSDSTIWSWGNNYWGQLGTGDRDFRSGPARLIGIDKATGIAAGGVHSLGVASTRTLYSWGSNAHLQLGMSSLPPSEESEEGEEFSMEPVVVPQL